MLQLEICKFLAGDFSVQLTIFLWMKVSSVIKTLIFLSAAHIKGNMSNLTIKSFSFTLSNYYMFVYIVNSGTFIDVFEPY
jgi:hypothetical protein